ncbi:MAG: rod shape-determining protein MreD [Actinomycetes bacterium]
MTTRRILLFGLLLVVAVVLQTVVLSRIPLPGATPDLVLIVVVSLALVQGSTTGCVVGFAGGLLLDVVPPADGQVGRWAFVLALVGWFAGRAMDAAESSALVPVLVVGLASAGAVLGYAAIGFALGDPRVDGASLLRALPTAVLYDVLLAPFLVPLLMRLARRVEPSTTYARTFR